MNRVFISAGRPANQQQADFRDSIMAALKLAGLSPHLMSDSDWDYRNPLRGIRKAMQGCCGVVIIAYKRYQVSGLELRSSGNIQLNAAFPTAWNHIEAAMAFERHLPLLVIAENGLKTDAFLDRSAMDVTPVWTDLDPNLTKSEAFSGHLHSWKSDVDEFATAQAEKARRKVPSEAGIFQVFASMPWYEALGLVAGLIALILGAASVGYRIGKGEWPF